MLLRYVQYIIMHNLLLRYVVRRFDKDLVIIWEPLVNFDIGFVILLVKLLISQIINFGACVIGEP